MYCPDCGKKQHTDECRNLLPSARQFARTIPRSGEFTDRDGAPVRVWSEPRRSQMATIWAVYTKSDDISALISIHHQAQDAVRAAGAEDDYKIAQLPYGMDFQDAIVMWEKNWRKANQNEERRAELRKYLEDQGYSPEKIDELVVHSDDDPDNS